MINNFIIFQVNDMVKKWTGGHWGRVCMSS